jgi:AraC-like DNA-binding protein
MMNAARSLTDLAGDPVGRYALGEGFLVWCATPALCGTALWGRLTCDTVLALTRAFDRAGDAGHDAPCDFVLDARHLEACDVPAFEAVTSALRPRAGELRRRIRCHALVRGPGVIGSAVAGCFASLELDVLARAFDQLEPALGWIGADGPVAPRLEQLINEAMAGLPALERLRTWLATHTGRPCSMAEAARALGVSSRSLQRTLLRRGTCFRAEVAQARLALAQQLLHSTDLKIAAIASRVGMSSESSFIAFFREATQLSPAAWRARSATPRARLARVER